MKRKNRALSILLALLMLGSLAGCGSKNAKDAEDYDILSVLFHQPYIDASGISLNCTGDRKDAIKKTEKALKKEPVYIKQMSQGILLTSRYWGRVSSSETYYYGELKDNRPNGFGVIARYPGVDLSDYSTLENLCYAGEFSKGQYDGYGASFEGFYMVGVPDELTGDADFELLHAYLKCYVSADGEWENGKLNGKANIFDFDKLGHVETIMDNAPKGYPFYGIYPSVEVAEMKNGYENGKVKQYLYNTLIYDGEMKDGDRDGDGTLYYVNGQICYKGHWKDGKYDGTGTKYSSDGTKEYSGKWKKGEYAS